MLPAWLDAFVDALLPPWTLEPPAAELEPPVPVSLPPIRLTVPNIPFRDASAAFKVNPIPLSVPLAPIVTVAGVPVAALVTVMLSTALPVAEDLINGFPLASLIVVTLGVVRTGLVEKTRFVEDVPVSPAAVYPVMLLKQVIEADEQLEPPLPTGSVPLTSVVKTTAENEGFPAALPCNSVVVAP